MHINILNSIKTTVTDTIQDKSVSPITITLIDSINTSGFNTNNWVQLTSSTIDASFITSGVINPARLASVSANYPSNSLTYLRGDSRFAPAVSSIRISDGSPIVLGSNNTTNSYIKQIQIVNGGLGYTVGTYTDTLLLGGNGGSEGLKGTIYVSDGTVRSVTVTNPGTGYTTAPTVLFKDNQAIPQPINSIKAVAIVSGGVITSVRILDGGSGLGYTPLVTFEGGGGVDATATCVVANGVIRTINITDGGTGFNADFDISPIPSILGTPTSAASLKSILATSPKIYNDTVIDINRVDGLTVQAEPFGNLGVVRLRKSQFEFSTNGGATLKTGQGSGLDADTLDTRDSSYFTNASNLQSGILPLDRLSGTYNISIQGNAGSATKLNIGDTRSSIFNPENFADGLFVSWKSNSQGYDANQFLADGGLYHSVFTVRKAGSSTDFSSGALSQLAQTDNNNLWIRNSGSNSVVGLTVTQGGSGYKNGTYPNILLGGGEGVGLRADITISGGAITAVTLKDGGWGYDRTGSAERSFQAVLPYEYFGTQNTRQVTTPAVITATLAFLGSGFSTGNSWTSWRKLWHDGNDGVGSGLDADVLQGKNKRWFGNALNINENVINNTKVPTQLDEHSFNKEIRVVVPSPLFQTNNGGHYDLYIDGYNLTQQIVDSLDTNTSVAGISLNLYTANNVNEGTVRVISRKINLDPANYLTGTSYVEENIEWNSSLTTLDRNDRVVHGHNVYKIVNANTGNYTAGTVPPTHNSGQVTATSGTAIYEFERKIENPWTILTVELISGNLTSSIKKVGTATAPAEYYPLSDFGTTSVETYARRKARLGSDGSGIAFLELGNVVESTSPYIDFNSSAQNVDYDVRIQASGGSTSVGNGTLNFLAANAQVNSNNIWHAGNVTFNTGFSGSIYTTTANGKAVIRDASGNFAANTITANLTGTASGNLALSGGTMSGNINFNQDQQGIVWARNSDGASIKFYNTGNGDTNSRLEFEVNDDNNEFFRWTHSPSGGTVYESMRLVSNSDNNALLTIGGNLQVGKTTVNQTITIKGQYNDLRMLTTDDDSWMEMVKPNGTVVGRIGFNGYSSESALYTYFDVLTATTSSASLGVRMRVDENGKIGFQGNPNANYEVTVNGRFAATSKSFLIDHPTKEGFKLAYGSLEGPEHGVYVRGRVTDGVIELPEYWTALVDEDTITVQLTAIGDSGNRWVIDVVDNKITTGGGAAFYFVQAERKDIESLEVEIKLPVEEEE